MTTERSDVPPWLPQWGNRPGLAPGRPQRARSEATVARLVEAGRQAFRDRGYDAARVDDVVELAGVSHGTFYLYFRNKEELLHRLALECADDLRRFSSELDALPVPVPIDLLSAWVEDFVASYRRNGPVLRVWLDRRDPDPLMQALADNVLGGMSTSLGRLVNPLVDSVVGSELVEFSLMVMLERIASYRRVAGESLDEGALVRVATRMMGAVMSVES